MEATSPIFAALGFVEFDALNDLAHWLDGKAEPGRSADGAGHSRNQAGRTGRPSTGREG
jgi:hypothetical protein